MTFEGLWWLNLIIPQCLPRRLGGRRRQAGGTRSVGAGCVGHSAEPPRRCRRTGAASAASPTCRGPHSGQRSAALPDRPRISSRWAPARSRDPEDAGLQRGDVRTTVAWQATTVAVIGLLVGLPLGVGIWSLRLVTDWQSGSSRAVVRPPGPRSSRRRYCSPTSSHCCPAGIAAGTRPAVVLRAERGGRAGRAWAGRSALIAGPNAVRYAILLGGLLAVIAAVELLALLVLGRLPQRSRSAWCSPSRSPPPPSRRSLSAGSRTA